MVNESEGVCPISGKRNKEDYGKEADIWSAIPRQQEQTGRGHYSPFAQRQAIGGFIRRRVRHHALRPFVWKMGEGLEQRPFSFERIDAVQKGSRGRVLEGGLLPHRQ